MNFKDSKEILKEVKKAKRVVLSCHLGADPDSVASCLLVKKVLATYNIKADVYSPEPIKIFHPFYKYLDTAEDIKVADFNDFDFSLYDLFFVVDVNELTRFGITKSLPQKLVLVNVDHHAGKKFDGKVVVNDTSFVSTSEMLFNLFEDWDVKFTKEMLRLALVGIISDSDMFNYSTTPRLFRTVAKIIDMGVDYDEVSTLLWRNNNIEQFKLLSKGLSKIKVDSKNRFAYSFIKYEDYKKFEEKKLAHPTRVLADGFLRTIENTDFGIVMIEKEKNNCQLSIRSRTADFASLPLVQSLGGGGHKDGGGAAIFNKPFKEASKIVLKAARDFAKTSK